MRENAVKPSASRQGSCGLFALRSAVVCRREEPEEAVSLIAYTGEVHSIRTIYNSDSLLDEYEYGSTGILGLDLCSGAVGTVPSIAPIWHTCATLADHVT